MSVGAQMVIVRIRHRHDLALKRKEEQFGVALAEGWKGTGEEPHFSQRTQEMGHPADLSVTVSSNEVQHILI